MDDGGGGINIKVMIGLAFALSVGLLCNILACALWDNWWPLFAAVAYFFAPVPNMICSRCGSDPLDQSGRNFKDMGFFLTGTLVVSGFGILVVLAHSEVIQIGAMFLALGGGLIIYATIIVFIHFFWKKKDDMF